MGKGTSQAQVSHSYQEIQRKVVPHGYSQQPLHLPLWISETATLVTHILVWALHMLSHLIRSTALMSGFSDHHFKDKERETQGKKRLAWNHREQVVVLCTSSSSDFRFSKCRSHRTFPVNSGPIKVQSGILGHGCCPHGSGQSRLTPPRGQACLLRGPWVIGARSNGWGSKWATECSLLGSSLFWCILQTFLKAIIASFVLSELQLGKFTLRNVLSVPNILFMDSS